MDSSYNLAAHLRPRTFSDMIGQPYAHGVGRRIGEGYISGQGYILAGPRGCGKTTLARIIAAAVNCPNRDVHTGDPCGSCESCLDIFAGSFPYVTEVDAASHRGIADMKSLLGTASYALPDGVWRVYIIDEAHMLTKEAWATLLKPIEEPCGQVMFVLSTTNPESIPDTIISRCCVVPITTLSDVECEKVVRRAVEEGMRRDPHVWSQIDDDDISAVVATSSGSARQAMTAISGIVFHGIAPSRTIGDVSKMVHAIVQADAPGALSLALDVAERNESDMAAYATTIMNGLIDYAISHPEHSENISHLVAQASVVCSDISRHIPKKAAAARMASLACHTNPVSDSYKTGEDICCDILLAPEGKKILGETFSYVLSNPDVTTIHVVDGTLRVLVRNDMIGDEDRDMLTGKISRLVPTMPVRVIRYAKRG